MYSIWDTTTLISFRVYTIKRFSQGSKAGTDRFHGKNEISQLSFQ